MDTVTSPSLVCTVWKGDVGPGAYALPLPQQPCHPAAILGDPPLPQWGHQTPQLAGLGAWVPGRSYCSGLCPGRSIGPAVSLRSRCAKQTAASIWSSGPCLPPPDATCLRLEQPGLFSDLLLSATVGPRVLFRLKLSLPLLAVPPRGSNPPLDPRPCWCFWAQGREAKSRALRAHFAPDPSHLTTGCNTGSTYPHFTEEGTEAPKG